jgi:hypothetical protein
LLAPDAVLASILPLLLPVLLLFLLNNSLPRPCWASNLPLLLVWLLWTLLLVLLLY